MLKSETRMFSPVLQSIYSIATPLRYLNACANTSGRHTISDELASIPLILSAKVPYFFLNFIKAYACLFISFLLL